MTARFALCLYRGMRRTPKHLPRVHYFHSYATEKVGNGADTDRRTGGVIVRRHARDDLPT